MPQKANNPILVDRAIVLWQRCLGNPKFQMFAPGEKNTSPLAEPMMQMLADRAGAPTEEQFQKFGDKLKELLLNPQKISDNSEHTRYVTHMSVDYHPDRILALAVDYAEIDYARFPIKTSIMLSDDHVCTSIGYGAPYENHYPLKNGDWLITSLSGKDIEKIITAVESGVDLGLTIEHPSN